MMPDNKIQQLEERIAKLELALLSFNTTAELAPEIQRTISLVLEKTSEKTAASATRAVNEAGSATYSVMFPPDGFIRIGDKNIPYID
jgi:hypothetical protein